MPKHIIRVSKPAKGKVLHSLNETEYRSMVLNGFMNEDRSSPEKFYRSLLDHFKVKQKFGGMAWAKDNKEWIREQISGLPRVSNK